MLSSKLMMSRLNHRYRRLERLGEGAYGIVYKARDLTHDMDVAIKVLKVFPHIRTFPYAYRETKFLQEVQCNHPNILRLLNVETFYNRVEESVRTCLVTELLQTDLKRHMNIYFPHGLPCEIVKKFTRELLSAVDCMHRKGIMHRYGLRDLNLS